MWLVVAWRSLDRDGEALRFVCAVDVFLLAYAGQVISNVPYLVPPTIDIWQAAAAPSSQMFLPLGTLILLPLVLGYTAFLYWVFRGKVRAGAGHH